MPLLAAYTLLARWIIKLKVRVNLNRIRNNIERLRAGTRVKFMLMVKADAYGHGLTEVAKATEDIVERKRHKEARFGADMRAVRD